jgi:hypothetical protein
MQVRDRPPWGGDAEASGMAVGKGDENAGPVAARADFGAVPWPRKLSTKLLGLTILFVLIAEVLIFIPSIANFRLH